MRLITLILAALIFALGCGTASAATGDLTNTGCFGPSQAGCATDFPESVTPWSEPAKVVASADGSSAYSIGGLGGIVQFDRDASGNLSFARCVTQVPDDGCDHLPSWASPLNGPVDIAISDDGRDVYTVARYSNGIAHFRVDASGNAAFAGCLGPVDDGCTALSGPTWGGQEPVLTVSPDGRNVYIAGDSGITELNRDAASGDLSFLGCFDLDTSCAMPPRTTGCDYPDCYAQPIAEAAAITVAPDGDSVYVASGGNQTGSRPGAIARFTRAGDGRLAFHDCIASSADVHGCRVASAAPMSVAANVAVSVAPSGRDIYTAAAPELGYGYSDAATHLYLDGDGNIAFSNCIGEHIPGCTTPPTGDGLLRWVHSIVAAPDGSDVYLESGTSLVRFRRQSNGDLAFVSCLSALTGCASQDIGVTNNQQMTIAADGSNVYAIAPSRVVSFRRQQAAPPQHAAKPSAPAPAILTQAATGVGTEQAVLTGDVNPLGTATGYHWEYGTSSAYGSRAPASDTPIGSGSGFRAASTRLTGLSPDTTYHFRLVATNAAGTARSRDLTFTTYKAPPRLPSGVGQVAEAGPADRSTTFQINPAHTGALPDGDPLAGPLLQRWSVDLGDLVSYPVVADGKVFAVVQHFGTGLEVVALDASSGAVRWTYPMGWDAWTVPGLAYDSGKVFMVGAPGRDTDRLGTETAFDAATGEVLWTKGHVDSSAPPVVSGGRVYSVTDSVGGLLTASNATTGEDIWNQLMMSGDRASPAIGGGNVFTSYYGSAYAFGTIDGSSAWYYGCGGCSGGGGGRTPVYAGGRVYLRDTSAQTGVVLDAASGNHLGDYSTDAENDPPPAISGSTMLLVHGGALTARDLGTATPKWTFEGDGGLVSAPIVVNDTVYVGSSSGRVFGIDMGTGQSAWSADTGAPILAAGHPEITSGLAAGDGVLVVPATGRLVAYSNGSDTGEPPADDEPSAREPGDGAAPGGSGPASDPSPAQSPSTPAGGGGTQSHPAAGTAFRLGLTVPRLAELGEVLRHGVVLHVSCSQACRLSGELLYRLHAKRAARIARTALSLHTARQATFRLTLSGVARRRLSHLKRTVLTVRVSAIAGGRTTTVVRHVTAARGHSLGIGTVRLPGA